MHKSSSALFLILISVTAVTFAAIYPSLLNGWTSWDDTIYVTENPYVTELSLRTVGYVFTHVVEGSYVPVTIVSFMIDYLMGGFDPAVYHRTNLLLHLCNTVLLILFMKKLSGDFVTALVAGILFGIHPMRVESVAWISGRKDLLAMFFFLLSSICYLIYLDKRKYLFVTLSYLLFLSALFSKTIVLTFPLILLLYDYQRNRRITTEVVNEKFPFFLASCAVTLVGFYGQESANTVTKNVDLLNHIVVALHGPVFYLEKFFLPVNLSNLYTYPAILSFSFYLYAAVFLAGSFAVWKYRKDRVLMFGMLFFAVSLIPVMQIIRFSSVFAADRFTYFAYIGLFYIVGTYASQWWGRFNKGFMLSVFSLLIIMMAYGTWNRSHVWKDNNTLWKDMLSKYPSPMDQ